MEAEELWETTMDPARRILHRVEYDITNFDEVDKIFTTLMGEDVMARKKFITDHYNDVQTLDI